MPSFSRGSPMQETLRPLKTKLMLHKHKTDALPLCRALHSVGVDVDRTFRSSADCPQRGAVVRRNDAGGGAQHPRGVLHAHHKCTALCVH